MGMAERIKERRLAMNLTQEELADKIGLQKSAIAKYENGRVENIKRSVIIQMSDILECSPVYLMGWDDELLPKQKESHKRFTKEWNIQFFENKILESFTQLNDENKKKSISYTENLLSNQKLDEELVLNAAHNTGATPEQESAADDIMMDDNEWN